MNLLEMLQLPCFHHLMESMSAKEIAVASLTLGYIGNSSDSKPEEVRTMTKKDLAFYRKQRN